MTILASLVCDGCGVIVKQLTSPPPGDWVRVHGLEGVNDLCAHCTQAVRETLRLRKIDRTSRGVPE